MKTQTTTTKQDSKQYQIDYSITYNSFIHLVNFNKLSGWINPVFIPCEKEDYKDRYYIIRLNNFTTIGTDVQTIIFNIVKRDRLFYIYVNI